MQDDRTAAKNRVLLISAILVTLPGTFLRIAEIHLSPVGISVASGAAIMGAAFLLLWACDAAQFDISKSLALAAVALMAVLPEYAVDMYFTWQAGQYPEAEYAHFAVANMTGANRLIIGVAWCVIAVICWWKIGKPVELERERRLELNFLFLATAYVFVIPLKGSIEWYDGIILIAMYARYMSIAAGSPSSEVEYIGPSQLLIELPTLQRRLATIGLFLFAGLIILINSEPFCEGLIGSGRILGINEFFLVQWIAPLASETPEFVVAVVFTLRLQASMALGSLLAAKLNQWTLLVGMIPLVFALSHGALDYPLPMNDRQMHEILLTAAQSLLAVMVLANMRLTLRHAMLLFFLFISQLFAPVLFELGPGDSFLGIHGDQSHQVFSLLYVFCAIMMFIEHPRRLFRFFSGKKLR